MMLWIVAVVSLFVSLAIYAYGYLFFQKKKLLDNPAKYGFEREAVPYSMGIWAVVAFIGLMIVFLDLNLQSATILIAVSLLGLVCFCDDLFGLSPKFRLVAQILLASLVVYGGTNILAVSNPLDFSEPIELGWWGLLFSVFWIVALTNLMNFLDGVSGLSSGVSSVGFLILLILSVVPNMHMVDQTMLQIMATSLFVIAFLAFIFEFPSPKFLIGDSGTMFFGFMLAVLSMINGGKLATAALVLMIPLFDGLWVILRRIYSKKSPFKGDYKHLHHRLERIGMSRELILISYVFVSLIFGLIAVFIWNTFFKVVSLLLLISALTVTGYLVWTKETK
jgi:UDP-GlcNAc:undecaprenyl-phosphate GlcNAc-1-phosphate transferase